MGGRKWCVKEEKTMRDNLEWKCRGGAGVVCVLMWWTYMHVCVCVIDL